MSYTCCMCQVGWRRPRPGDSARFARQRMKAWCDGWPAQVTCRPGRSDCLPDRSDCLPSQSDCLPGGLTACHAVWLPARRAWLLARQVRLPARPVWLPAWPPGWTAYPQAGQPYWLSVHGLPDRSSAIGCPAYNSLLLSTHLDCLPMAVARIVSQRLWWFDCLHEADRQRQQVSVTTCKPSLAGQ